uniref:DUF4283 domain-containing protein n=1 Tax=Cannabis sativa TaxID=3483 RepID=A0A803P2S8_CANSA
MILNTLRSHIEIPSYIRRDLIEKTIVGRTFFNKGIFKGLLRSVFAQKWRLWKGWNIKEEDKNIYMLRFHKKNKADFVVARSPWAVCGGHMVLKSLPAYGRWWSANLDLMAIWVRVYVVPPRFFTTKNATAIARKICGIGNGKLNLDAAVEVDEARIGDQNVEPDHGIVLKNGRGDCTKNGVINLDSKSSYKFKKQKLKGLVRKDINGLGFAIGPTLEGHGPSKKRRHGETSFEGNNWANTGIHELVGPIKKMFSRFINDNGDKLGKEYEVKEGCPVGNFDKGPRRRAVSCSPTLYVSPFVKLPRAQKTSGSEGIANVDSLDFNAGVATSTLGAAGGVALFWKIGWNIQVLSLCIDKIIVRFGEDMNFKSWVGCFVYGPPKRNERDSFGGSMIEMVNGLVDEWVVMGDVNSILNQNEKLGGRPVCESEGRGLQNFVFDCGAIDLKGMGAMFTWSNGQDWHSLVREKEDRFLCSSNWLTLFPKAGSKIISIRHSDHATLVLDTVMDGAPFKAPF